MLTPKQKKYLKERIRINDKFVKDNAKLEELRIKAAKNCKHDPEVVVSRQVEHDDGYGKQTNITGKYCTICKRTCYWPGSSLWALDSKEDI